MATFVLPCAAALGATTGVVPQTILGEAMNTPATGRTRAASSWTTLGPTCIYT